MLWLHINNIKHRLIKVFIMVSFVYFIQHILFKIIAMLHFYQCFFKEFFLGAKANIFLQHRKNMGRQGLPETTRWKV